MNETVSYDRQTVASPNPLARFSHAKRQNLAEQLVLEYLPDGGRFLDFGAGDGRLLGNLRKHVSADQLHGYEPYMAAQFGYHRVASISEAEPQSYDVIGAFEVLEHLNPAEIDEYEAMVRRLLKPGGRAILSVPIMHGPVLFLKCANAKFIKRIPMEYSMLEMVKSGLLLRDVPRGARRLYETHKGFSWRGLGRRLDTFMELERQIFSPFPRAWWGINSQWFAIYSLRPGR